jgi:hypothetical protein
MFPLPFVLTVGDSRHLRLFLAAVHVACAFGIFLAAIDPAIQWSGLVLLILSLSYHWRPSAAARLRCGAEGKLEIWQDDQWREAKLASSSVILPSCTLLLMRIENTQRNLSLVLLVDSLPPDDFRRLRVWLRWRGARSASTGTGRRRATEMPDQ